MVFYFRTNYTFFFFLLRPPPTNVVALAICMQFLVSLIRKVTFAIEPLVTLSVYLHISSNVYFSSSNTNPEGNELN